MVNIRNIEVLEDKYPIRYLYHWGTEDEVKRLKENGINITDPDDTGLFVEIGYNGIEVNPIKYEKDDDEKLQLIRIELDNVFISDDVPFTFDSDCIIREMVYNRYSLTTVKGSTCTVKPEFIQASQVFTNKWLKDNHDKRKIVLKFE